MLGRDFVLLEGRKNLNMRGIGRYFMFLRSMLIGRERLNVYIHRTIDECVIIGVGSIFFVVIVSVFTGAVSSIQIYHNIRSPFLSSFLPTTECSASLC